MPTAIVARCRTWDPHRELDQRGAAVFYAAFAKSGVLQLLCAHSEVLCDQAWNGSHACAANVLVRLYWLTCCMPNLM
jgi:hypothetical protein